MIRRRLTSGDVALWGVVLVQQAFYVVMSAAEEKHCGKAEEERLECDCYECYAEGVGGRKKLLRTSQRTICDIPSTNSTPLHYQSPNHVPRLLLPFALQQYSPSSNETNPVEVDPS
jgi:hypothetical protein